MAQLEERVETPSFFNAGDTGSIPGLAKFFYFILFFKVSMISPQKMFLLGLPHRLLTLNVRNFRTRQFFGANFLQNTQCCQVNDTSMCSLIRNLKRLPNFFNIKFVFCPKFTFKVAFFRNAFISPHYLQTPQSELECNIQTVKDQENTIRRCENLRFLWKIDLIISSKLKGFVKKRNIFMILLL